MKQNSAGAAWLPPAATVMVAHDAGGAEILSSIARQARHPIQFCLGGPAVSIFRRKLGEVSSISVKALSDSIDTRALVLTATSLESDLEKEVLRVAASCGASSAAFLDHWMHYRKRFASNAADAIILPDQIFVGDEFGFAQALKEGLPESRLVIYPNPHFTEVRQSIEERTKALPLRLHQQKHLLFLCEPISLTVPDCGFDELTLVRELCENSSKLCHQFQSIRIRPHPREPAHKYDHLVSKVAASCDLSISNRADFIDDIAWSDSVIAIESMGLVHALNSGRQAVSWIPSARYQCHLPHSGLQHITTITQLADL